jgi:transcriptional regulator with XRE-family HTH domain
MHYDNKKRSEYLNKQLDKRGVASWGRASEIARRTGCSNATADAWLKGSLPKNIQMGINFADEFGLDFYEWSTGKSRGAFISESRLTELIHRCKNFEDKYNIDLNAKQMAALILMGESDEQSLETFMENLRTFLAK